MKYVLAGGVVIIDDLSSRRMQNIGHVLAGDTVSFIEGSITDREFLQSSFKGAEGVFHQAALASVPNRSLLIQRGLSSPRMTA